MAEYHHRAGSLSRSFSKDGEIRLGGVNGDRLQEKNVCHYAGGGTSAEAGIPSAAGDDLALKDFPEPEMLRGIVTHSKEKPSCISAMTAAPVLIQ